MSSKNNDDQDKFNTQLALVDDLNKELALLDTKRKKILADIKLNNKILYSICNHNYIKECINDGCYREYAFICSKCKKIN